MHQAAHHQEGGQALADHGGDGHARHIQLEHDDQQQVQGHVEDTGGNQVVEGTPGVAHRAQQRRAEVIQHGGGHAQEVDPQIKGRQGQDGVRHLHQMQQRTGGGDAHHGQQNTAEERQQHGGVHRLAQALPVARAGIAGRQNIGAHGQSHEQVHHQVDEGGVGAHGGQGVVSGEFAHHHDIRRVEQQLQHAGAHQRQGEGQYFRQQLTAAHVDLIAAGTGHGWVPPCIFFIDLIAGNLLISPRKCL